MLMKAGRAVARFCKISALIIISIFISLLLPSLAEAIMPPQCDKDLSRTKYFLKYVDTPAFRTVHPSFPEWNLISNNADDRFCINRKDEQAVIKWQILLPSHLSRYGISYLYELFLVVNWDLSAKIPHPQTPEQLIQTVEALPETVEFLDKYGQILEIWGRTNTAVIGVNSYSPTVGTLPSPEIRYQAQENSMTLTAEGLQWADLNLHQTWSRFPFTSFLYDLAKKSLSDSSCTFEVTDKEVVRYFSPRQENGVWQKLSYLVYIAANCPLKYTYVNIDIDPSTKGYIVSLENEKQIASGVLSGTQLELLGISKNVSSSIGPSPRITQQESLPPSPTLVTQRPLFEDVKDNTNLVVVFIFLLSVGIFVGVFFFLRKRWALFSRRRKIFVIVFCIAGGIIVASLFYFFLIREVRDINPVINRNDTGGIPTMPMPTNEHYSTSVIENDHAQITVDPSHAYILKDKETKLIFQNGIPSVTISGTSLEIVNSIELASNGLQFHIMHRGCKKESVWHDDYATQETVSCSLEVETKEATGLTDSVQSFTQHIAFTGEWNKPQLHSESEDDQFIAARLPYGFLVGNVNQKVVPSQVETVEATIYIVTKFAAATVNFGYRHNPIIGWEEKFSIGPHMMALKVLNVGNTNTLCDPACRNIFEIEISAQPTVQSDSAPVRILRYQ